MAVEDPAHRDYFYMKYSYVHCTVEILYTKRTLLLEQIKNSPRALQNEKLILSPDYLTYSLHFL